MNTKRIFFWITFVVILGLIVWGLVVAMNKPVKPAGLNLGTPADVSSSTDHIRGSASVPVTVIEYSDFQCPACAAYYPMVERVYAEASSSMRLVYRHFPLSQHIHSELAAEVAEAAGRQGKFWEMYHELFPNQTDWAESDKAAEIFNGYAREIGLDMNKFKADLADPTIKDAIKADQEDGQKIGVSGTPTFFVNGKAVVNPQSYEAFKALIDQAAKPGQN